MRSRRWGTLISLVAALSACGGGGSGGGGSSGAPGPIAAVPPPPPPPSASTCTLRARQDWAAAQLHEWYLFPETLPASLDPTPYASVSDYIDALTATARAQGRDRFFTYLTSIAAENAFNNSGSSAGFGLRFALDGQGRLFVTEAFEGAPGLAAGIDRGAQVTAIGTSTANLQNVSDILASQGTAGLNDALGPSTVGTTRVFRISDASGTRDVTVAKANYDLVPVSTRYGVKIINDGGRKVGYVNLRTFINTADPELRDAFSQFRTAGVTDVIVDLRYNGGGLISIAELFGDLLGGARSASDIFDLVSFRPEKAANNSSHHFTSQPESLSPAHIAFIGTGGTASASELVINGMLPYFHANEALIGTNTYGKPVGQIAIDQVACDDRLRLIAFSLQNGAGQGAYFAGLASTMEASCAAGDDLAHPMGDPQEVSTRAALDFLGGKTCPRITATAGAGTEAANKEQRALLTPARPDSMQRDVPGAY